MEAVHVLVGVDCGEHGVSVYLRGQGQLHEDAVHLGVGVHRRHEGQEFGLRRLDRQAVGERAHARHHGLLALVAHVDLARGVFTDDHDGQAGNGPIGLHEIGDGQANPLAQACGEGLSVDDPGAHGGGIARPEQPRQRIDAGPVAD